LNDADAMRLALELASLGEGSVNPNPLVGAVIVRDGRVIGRGYHRRFGGPHAEIFALEEAGDATRGADLFVTLEPCSHHGKTPPCTDRIIEAGIARAIVAVRDPNPTVNGAGIACLRRAGIDVIEGVLAEEAARQNEVFFKFITTGSPFVHLKLAVSLDGRIATRSGDSKWITGEASRVEAHRLRRKLASILVGVGTVIADDPELSVRHVPGENPVPIVLDPTGRIPASARLLLGEVQAIIVTSTMDDATENALISRGARVWRIPSVNGRLDLRQLGARLGRASIDSVLVEGGAETAGRFLDAGVIDKVTVFIAPTLVGGREAISSVGGLGIERMAHAWRLRDVSVRRIGEDLCVTGYPRDGARQPEKAPRMAPEERGGACQHSSP